MKTIIQFTFHPNGNRNTELPRIYFSGNVPTSTRCAGHPYGERILREVELPKTATQSYDVEIPNGRDKPPIKATRHYLTAKYWVKHKAELLATI